MAEVPGCNSPMLFQGMHKAGNVTLFLDIDVELFVIAGLDFNHQR